MPRYSSQAFDSVMNRRSPSTLFGRHLFFEVSKETFRPQSHWHRI
ncbi:hypothetical protein GFS60_03259 [Rhodococcus sp. WAY2]|nr:hypothetical protein GFS60_03259 [Rhodococcus sp. WAY2]